jgi:hypothetical protein
MKEYEVVYRCVHSYPVRVKAKDMDEARSLADSVIDAFENGRDNEAANKMCDNMSFTRLEWDDTYIPNDKKEKK